MPLYSIQLTPKQPPYDDSNIKSTLKHSRPYTFFFSPICSDTYRFTYPTDVFLFFVFNNLQLKITYYPLSFLFFIVCLS